VAEEIKSVHPLILLVLGLLGTALLSVVGWSVKTLFSKWYSRIIIRKLPRVIVKLRKSTHGYHRPHPELWLDLEGARIKTRQTADTAEIEGEIRFPGMLPIEFKERFDWLDTNLSIPFPTIHRDLQDFSLWQNGRALQGATCFTLYIGKHSKLFDLPVSNVETWTDEPSGE
jgi:hypothetical protein